MAEHVRDWSGATASGALFDTGRGYPAAQFNVEGTITGAALVVASENLASVIQTLDAIEVDYRTLVIAGQVVVVRRGRVVVG
jgi:gamma-glutamylcyclotransferase (GGCT)/AIG2-like uncharacterized protein YtfP